MSGESRGAEGFMAGERMAYAVVREDLADAVLLRVVAREVRDDDASRAVRDALFRAAETCDRPVVLDLSAVEYLTSAALGWMITLRARLRGDTKPFASSRRRRGLFAIFRDSAEAVEAIRRGEPDPLVLCGVNELNRDIFCLC